MSPASNNEHNSQNGNQIIKRSITINQFLIETLSYGQIRSMAFESLNTNLIILVQRIGIFHLKKGDHDD